MKKQDDGAAGEGKRANKHKPVPAGKTKLERGHFSQ
jgi:hypothetical protein